VEQLVARPFRPAPLLRGWRLSRHLPGAPETNEVIEPESVESRQPVFETVDPPAVAAAAQPAPPVMWISPALARLAEEVRRYAGDDRRASLVIELEQIAVRPNVRTVVRHEER
jgi:hypothetical protein